MKTPILKAKSLHKSFHSPEEVQVLKGVDLTVSPGETVAIMGRSGEGKSTLLHILGTLEHPSQGELSIVDQLVSSKNASIIRNRHIGFVYQAFHLLDDYSVLENVLFPAMIGRQNLSLMRPRALELLEQVGLSSRATFNAKLLSGGEKQRVAIARALMNNPHLILADEPSGNLDSKTAENIHGLLINFAKNENKGLIIVTHDADLAQMCDSIYTLHQGVLHRQ